MAPGDSAIFVDVLPRGCFSAERAASGEAAACAAPKLSSLRRTPLGGHPTVAVVVLAAAATAVRRRRSRAAAVAGPSLLLLLSFAPAALAQSTYNVSDWRTWLVLNEYNINGNEPGTFPKSLRPLRQIHSLPALADSG